MKTMAAYAGLLAALALAVGCADTPTSIAGGPYFSKSAQAHRVSVMAQNLYVGANDDAVLAALQSADPNDDLPALIGAIETLHNTDFTTRAAGIVEAIAQYRPHVVGFNEVSNIHINIPGLRAVNIEFMPIIQEQLAARGLHYTVAATVENVTADPLPGVSLVDYDAILVDTDRASIDFAYTQNFSNNVGTVATGVVLKRGLVEVAAYIEGQRYFFVVTHLEPDLPGMDFSALRQAQAWELAFPVLGDSTPAFVMGDLNDAPDSPMYQVLQAAGFHDVWRDLRPGVEGFTNPRNHELRNVGDELTQRIDFIWARGVGNEQDRLQGQITRVGVNPSDLVRGPSYKMWPSDHAGLVADLLVPNRNR